MVRFPNRTSRLSSSITGAMCLRYAAVCFECSRFLAQSGVIAMEHGRKRGLHQQIHGTAEGGHLNAVRLGIRADKVGPIFSASSRAAPADRARCFESSFRASWAFW